MPLFFVISGYLHKQPNSMEAFVSSIRRKTVRLLVPYVSFYFLILTVLKIESNQPLSITLTDITRLLLGGQNLGSGFAPLWFVTVLYLTQLAFSLLLLKVRNGKGVAAVIFSAYVLAYFDSVLSLSGRDIHFIWNADVALLAIGFYSIGYLLKRNKTSFDGRLLVICSLITCTAIGLDALGTIDYSLNMRSSRYNHFILDLLIPVAISVLIIYLSHVLEKSGISKYLGQIGKYSLSIMYLHLTLNIISDHFMPRNFLFVTIIGVTVPILISKYFFETNYVTRFLFLGEVPQRKPRQVTKAV